MKIILSLVVGFILLTGLILLLRDHWVRRKFRKALAQKYTTLEPLIEKLQSRKENPRPDVLKLSADPSFRIAVYRILGAFRQTDLFPEEYMNVIKGAESYLVNWLEFPTELGKAPDRIRFFRKITLGEVEELDYYVFKFSVDGHPSMEDGMMGICGPYRKESLPFDVPARIYSRFKTIESTSPEIEVRWVHENINKHSST